MNFSREYNEKLMKAEEAVKLVKSGDWVDYGFGNSMPEVLDEALAARKNELSDIKVRGLLAIRPLKIVEEDQQKETFTYNSWHFSGYERKLYDKGLCSYIPMIYRNLPSLYRNQLKVNVAMMSVSPMDKHGYFSFSLSNSASKAILETADIVILEVNKNLPRVLGVKDECIHISEVDAIVEGKNSPLVELPSLNATEVDKRIAKHIVEQIEDGSTIQLGIGGLPNMVGKMIAKSDLKDLGMHTEMLVDAYLEMYKSGKLTNKRKNIDTGKGVFSFCLGSKELYEWIDLNPGLASYPVDYVNEPAIMSQNDKLITINNCISVDLYGQICAETAGIRNISGTGGQLDFLTGAYMSKGGKAFICMASTFKDKKGNLKSNIIPSFTRGDVITDPRSQTYYIATEWGIANLAGRSTWERASELINIAHPNFRDELIKEAENMKIWKKSNKK